MAFEYFPSIYFVLSKLIVPTAFPLQEVMSPKSGSVFLESALVIVLLVQKPSRKGSIWIYHHSPLFSLVLTLLGVEIKKTRCGRTWQATLWHSRSPTIDFNWFSGRLRPFLVAISYFWACVTLAVLTTQSSWLLHPNLADDSPKTTHLRRIVDVVRIVERFTPIVKERRRGPTEPLWLASPVAQCDTLNKSSSRIAKLRRQPVVYDIDHDFLDRRARRSDRSCSDNCNGNFGYIASSWRSERRTDLLLDQR